MQASMYVFLWLVLVVVGCVVYKFTVYRVPGDSVAEPEPSLFWLEPSAPAPIFLLKTMSVKTVFTKLADSLSFEDPNFDFNSS